MRKAMSVIAVAYRGCRAPEDARHLGVGLSASEIGQSNVRLFLGHDTRKVRKIIRLSGKPFLRPRSTFILPGARRGRLRF